MTALTVARKDFSDAVQSRALWALVALFALVAVAAAYAYAELPAVFGSPDGATFAGLIFFMVGLTSLFVPLTAIVACYKALAGERELGSIKLLLSLPTTRRHVFAGKLLGRAAVLAVGLGVGLLVGLGVGATLIGHLDLSALLAFAAITLAFAVVYAAIIVSLSATTGSTARATTLALGFFVLFELAWDVVPLAVVYVTNGFTLPSEFPAWMYLLTQLSPSTAYLTATIALLPDLATTAGATPPQGAATTGDPFYVTPEVGLLVLAMWLLVPLTIGLHRFTTADL